MTFQGELGIELNVDRASGAVRIKRAEADSPAKPHEGAALRSINGKPVGRIESKAAWLALVERLKAPARPLVLALEVPEDPRPRPRPPRAPRRRRVDGPSAAAGRGPGALPPSSRASIAAARGCDLMASFGFKLGSPFAAKPARPRV